MAERLNALGLRSLFFGKEKPWEKKQTFLLEKEKFTKEKTLETESAKSTRRFKSCRRRAFLSKERKPRERKTDCFAIGIQKESSQRKHFASQNEADCVGNSERTWRSGLTRQPGTALSFLAKKRKCKVPKEKNTLQGNEQLVPSREHEFKSRRPRFFLISGLWRAFFSRPGLVQVSAGVQLVGIVMPF